MTEIFGLPLLQSISDWQRSSTLRRGLALKEQSALLPEEYRTCRLCCFRQIALPKDGVWSLIGEDCLPEKVSSWTLDLETAKQLKGGVPPEGQGYQGVILSKCPDPSNVIINLNTLYTNTAFKNAMDAKRFDIQGYHDGAGRYQNSQSEVILELSSANQEDIYSLGGYSSPFEELVDIAANLVYGRKATSNERDDLLLKSEHIRSEAGANWLTPEATQRVIKKMKPHADRLKSVKKLQESSDLES